jgi:hypothetical protein
MDFANGARWTLGLLLALCIIWVITEVALMTEFDDGAQSWRRLGLSLSTLVIVAFIAASAWTGAVE